MSVQLILGGGEIGSAYARLFRAVGMPVYVLDTDKSKCDPAPAPMPGTVACLHVCLRYTPEFKGVVLKAISRFQPELINIMSTVPPGTSEQVHPDACHSTTRGMHPALDEGIRRTPKHIGGPKAKELAEVFGAICWEPPVLHPFARTTELCHIASNFQYAANVLAADEIDRWCRAFGVDFFDFQKYSESHNTGYLAQGLHSKVRPIMYPSGGAISGHCIKLATELIPPHLHGPLTQRLKEYK